MKNPIRNGVLAMLAGAALSAATPAPVQAQNQPRQVPRQFPQQFQDGQPQQQDPGPIKLSVNFAGGTVEQYVQALQQAAGNAAVNIVVPAEAKKVSLPPIALREVTVYTALSAIIAAFEANSSHNFGVDTVGNQTDQVFAVQYQYIDPAAKKAAQMYPGMQPGMMPQGPIQTGPAKRLDVYSIRDLIDPPSSTAGGGDSKVAFESILAAVEAAMGLLESADAPRIMFHKETGLLLVGGSAYQLEVVQKLLDRIREDLHSRWATERQGRKNSAESSKRLMMAQAEMELAAQEFAVTEQRYERTRTAHEAGQVAIDEVSVAETNMMRAKVNVDRRRMELEMLQQEANSTEPTEPEQKSDLPAIIVPAPISDGEIAKLSRADATREFSNRKAAAAKTDDLRIRQRLLDEAEKCKKRMSAAAKE